MRILLIVATALQVAAVAYCTLLLRRHRNAATPWLCLLGALMTMLVWRVVMATGATPTLTFNTSIAMTGSVCAVLAMFFFGREMVRRERAEAERDHLLGSEHAARLDAERASRIKDDFMATLSHELRTPLSAVLGWCAIAQKEALSAGVARAIDTIERNARVQTRLIDDLLDATRMQAGSLHLELAPVRLDGPVIAAMDGVKPAAERKKLQVRYTCTTPAPVVIGDRSRLQQIASNLLVNAVKFTPEGKAIDVTLASAGEHVELTVSDQGIGIDPAFKPHLFQRFLQADNGTARRHGGLGLGLSIVSSLVQLHQGEVHATSDGLGTGATFVVRLPRSKSDTVTPQVDTHGVAASAGPDASLNGIRVIVVDDEADVLGAVVGLLERAGATVRGMASGASIDVTIAEFRPDVLVLDIGMPGEDGYTLIRRIRRLPNTDGGDLPAISLTAHAREEDHRHAMEAGFQAHLAKPVNVAMLLTTIHHLARPRTKTGIVAAGGQATAATGAREHVTAVLNSGAVAMNSRRLPEIPPL
jgi:signal transduction histidine kinase/ActR/RegA family two-component response regulator